MPWLATGEGWIAFLTLVVLELVLGVDNIVFVTILVDRLPKGEQPRARFIGLALAMGMRILLLFGLTWIMGLTKALFAVLGHEVSGRDLILLSGGLFLLAKATREIHQKLEGEEGASSRAAGSTFGSVLLQIALLDMVFSLDSVITAVGMAGEISIMVAAVVVSVALMMWLAGPVGAFVTRHPTVKMLALSFLLLIGATLVAEGWGFHFPKGYVYFAMAFSVFVEALNLRLRRKSRPVHLREPYRAPDASPGACGYAAERDAQER